MTAIACKYCGSRFPHVRFADSCEWTVSKNDQAYACPCGSVKFCILREGKLECAKCKTEPPYTVTYAAIRGQE